MSATRQPFSERLKDLVSDLVDGLLGALSDLLDPAPAPVPIPVRGRRR